MEPFRPASRMAGDCRPTRAAVERKIPADIREEGRAAVDAKLLSEMLRLLGGDTVTLETSQHCKISVTSGETEYLVSMMDGGDYPRAEIPFPD